MIDNCFAPAFEARGTTVTAWGKDNTNTVEYQFNNSGFRSSKEYTESPDYAIFGASNVFGVGVPIEQTMCELIPHCQNYGIAGNYLNHHSVDNLKKFIASPLYQPKTKLVFFWIDRPGIEDIAQMIHQVNEICPGVLHINLGVKVPGAINLFPHVDLDVSKTQPGPKTHAQWARVVQLLCNKII
jgi:hypothetical protein